ncbi:MAG TPA: 16S rRNA (cytidine(1402)-2'-O)-methyltransferase [bacterium]|nr:16S rRNA (cytidine(1402)-2'-O)-methyltransferase [bacterium]HMW35122.1 16S rRNA (cytidine(1402)-2'-O)-methyltransferase [bacterium]HMY36472.1 16S rRNA (cytidine(1402)-2'-O)-methyltransferase [bacterium]HMZ03976.1 16S rRNA (cytidine(1402)-2'-O)-methyltransferase [bacterium]HNB58301.1 16S rRNA (cytidine(1402)-2'-O)-methyltransferase [bacterium]
MSGILYIVATPIGNLEDITLRAIRVLKEADTIACEDTRQSKILFDHYGITARMVSLFEHNELRRIPEILQLLMSGKSVAVVSDAGTPTISDPAFKLVRAVREAGLPVSAVPGPSAALAAISVSGLPTDRFVFEGFLPHKKGRQTRWKTFAEEDRTIVLYESPFRVMKTLSEAREYLGERPMVVAREITKKFEETVSGTPSELIAHFEKHAPRGEFVILIAGKKYAEKALMSEEENEEN